MENLKPAVTWIQSCLSARPVMTVIKSTIESQQLQVYVMLARLLNMSRAAEELAMTPSGVSHCLKTLENDLGCRLFERTSRTMTLTRAGGEFLRDASEILERMQSVRKKIRSWGDWRQGQIRIGANATASRFILPPALREFRESFPDFTVKIELCTPEQAGDFLKGGRLDLVFGLEPSSLQGLHCEFLAEDDLFFIVHPLHPWAVQRRVSREEIPTGKLIMPEASSDTFRLIEAYFKKEGLTVHPFIEVAGEDAVKHFIELDMGVGILPRWIVAKEIEQGRLTALPLGRRRLRRRWGVLSSPSDEMRFAENLLVSICRSVLSDLVSRSLD